MQKIITVSVALCVLITTLAVAEDAAPAASPTPAPIGLTVSGELNLIGLKSPNAAQVGLNLELDYDHEFDHFEFEGQVKRLAVLTNGGSNAGSLYVEINTSYHIDLGKDLTLTPFMSWQDTLNLGSSSSSF